MLRSTIALALCATLLGSSSALAWGAAGHRLVGSLAMRALPLEVPEFLRKLEPARQVGEVAREPDRLKGAGQPYDADDAAAHRVDVGDDLKIARGPSLSALPPSREVYDTALRASMSNQYRAGYLPYAIMDAWQQVVMDFAYWRADVAGFKYAKTSPERTWFLQDQWIREGMMTRDLGYLAHFVGDGSEPLNVSVHSDGWGDYPNPLSFSNAKGLHALVDSVVARSRIAEKDVTPYLTTYRDCRCTIQRRTADYLTATQEFVVRLYQIEKSDGFAGNSENSKIFVARRLAAGASELRDMIVDAWHRSAEISIGSPPIEVRDLESGEINGYDALRGTD